MSDSDVIGGGIVGAMIGHKTGFDKGWQQGYQQAKLEDQREITSLHNEIMNLKEQIRKLQSKK